MDSAHMGEDQIEKPKDVVKEVECQIFRIEENVNLAIEKFTKQLDAINLQIDSLHVQLMDLKDITESFKLVHEWFNRHNNACPTGPTAPPPSIDTSDCIKII